MKNTILLITCILFTACIPLEDTVSLEGQWSCEETSEIYMAGKSGSGETGKQGMKGTSVFPVYIAQDALSSNAYYIDNFYNMGSGKQVSFTVFGRSITIALQTTEGIEFIGTGTISTDYNTIELAYTADDGGGLIDHVTSIYTR